MNDGHPDDDIEDLLDRFRGWLEDARAAAEDGPGTSDATGSAPRAPRPSSA